MKKMLAKAVALSILLGGVSFVSNNAYAAQVNSGLKVETGAATGIVVATEKKGAITELATQESLKNVNTQVEQNSKDIAKKANQTDLDATNAEVAKKANQTDLDATNAEVAKKANQTDLDATNAEVAKKANQTDLDATNAEVAKKANQTDLDATNAEVAKKANQTDLDATNAEVAKKADKVALEETNGKVETNEKNIEKLNGEVSRLDNKIDKLDDRVEKVGAMAAAIANLHTMGYDPAAPTEFAVGVGQYRDKTGVALGAFHYPNRDFMLSFSVSSAGDEYMGGIGATWRIGRKSPEKMRQDAAEKAVKARLAKAEADKKAAKDARVAAQQKRHAEMLAAKQGK